MHGSGVALQSAMKVFFRYLEPSGASLFPVQDFSLIRPAYKTGRNNMSNTQAREVMAQ